MEFSILAVPAEQQPAAPAGEPGGFGSLLPFLLVIFVVLLFMPLFSKKERHRQKRVQGIKKHDRVVTSGGIFGTVIAFDDQTVSLEVAKGVRLTFKRSSIYDIEKPTEGGSAEAPAKESGAKE